MNGIQNDAKQIKLEKKFTLFNVTPPVIAPPSSKYRSFNAPRTILQFYLKRNSEEFFYIFQKMTKFCVYAPNSQHSIATSWNHHQCCQVRLFMLQQELWSSSWHLILLQSIVVECWKIQSWCIQNENWPKRFRLHSKPKQYTDKRVRKKSILSHFFYIMSPN